MKGIYKIPDNLDEINKELEREIEELFYGLEIEASDCDSDERSSKNNHRSFDSVCRHKRGKLRSG